MIASGSVPARSSASWNARRVNRSPSRRRAPPRARRGANPRPREWGGGPRRKLGERFTLRAFHDALLRAGTLPIAIMRDALQHDLYGARF